MIQDLSLVGHIRRQAPSILVVDDKERFRYALRFNLTEVYGAKVSEFGDGKDALGGLKGGEYYDLVFVDVSMPGVDGVEFCREIMDRGLASHLVLMSAYSDAGARVDAEAIGLKIFRKPMSQDCLTEEISKALVLRQSRPSGVYRRKILVVDDDYRYRKLIKFEFGPEFDIFVAGSVREAVSVIEVESNVDVVVLDLQLPDRSGLDFVGELSALGLRPKVIVLTAFPELLGPEEAILRDISYFLAKESRGHIGCLRFAVDSLLYESSEDRRVESLRVFICCASEDVSTAKVIHDKLVLLGHRPWLYSRDLLPGEHWKRRIKREIEQSEVFFFCLSPRSVSKAGFVQAEFRFALEMSRELPAGRVFIIPVILEDCEMPGDLEHISCIRLDSDKCFEKIEAALSAHVVSTTQKKR